MTAPTLRTCLTFDGHAEEAARFYVSHLADSAIESVYRPGGEHALVVAFTLAGAPYMALNASIGAAFTPAISICVLADDQAEVDRLWNAIGEGGTPGMCGWLTDRFGVSWQIVPRALPDMLMSADRDAAARVQQALLTMSRIDIDALRRVGNKEETP